jgi:hypothetical protein
MTLTHTHDSMHQLHQSIYLVRAHLSNSHGIPIPTVDRMTDDEALTAHQNAHVNGPTAEDRAAGIAAATDAAIAGALRLLARRHLGEMDHAHLPIDSEGEDNNVSIVAVDRVQSWLEGWAIRIENGAEL